MRRDAFVPVRSLIPMYPELASGYIGTVRNGLRTHSKKPWLVVRKARLILKRRPPRADINQKVRAEAAAGSTNPIVEFWSEPDHAFSG